MRFVKLSLLLLAALFLATEPVVHTHPLIADSGSTDVSGISSPNVCAICAVGAERIVTVAAVATASLVVVDHVVPIHFVATSVDAPLPSSSRGPPAA